MPTRSLAAVAPMLFALSALHARFWGGDKAPFLVLAALGLAAILALAFLVNALAKSNPRAWQAAAVATLPVAYAVAALAAARMGWVDSISLLGFR